MKLINAFFLSAVLLIQCRLGLCQTETPTISPAPTISHEPTGMPSGQPSVPTAVPSSSSPSLDPTISSAPTISSEPTTPTSMPSGQPSGIPSSEPSIPTGMPSGEPSSDPTSAPSTIFSTFLTTDYMNDCYSTCSYSGSPAVSTWTETEFCLFYTDSGAAEATVRDYSVVPTCLEDCPYAYCHTFSVFADQCGSSNAKDLAAIESIFNDCLDGYRSSIALENRTNITFAVDLYFSGVDADEFDNPVAQAAAVFAVVNSMRRADAMTGTFVRATYTEDRRLSEVEDEDGQQRRRLLGTTVIEVQIATTLSALGYSDALILQAFSDLKAEIDAAVTGTELTTLFQQYATNNGYTPIGSLGIESYVGISGDFIPSPTSLPSGIPSSEPTSPTNPPTSLPSAIPSAFPTSMPSISHAPTYVVNNLTVTGNITVDRDENDLCKPTEIRIHISFDRSLLEQRENTRQSIYLDLPGFTNGPCTSPENGFDFHPEAFSYSSTSPISLLFYEGSYSKMYRDTQLRIYLEGAEESEVAADTNIEIVIDRDQGIRFSCMQETNFPVTMRYIRSDEYFEARGTLDFLSFTPQFCFVYNSSISFFPPREQIYTTLNLTLQLATDFKYGDNITLYLPGFTNGASFSSSYDTYNSWGRTSTSGESVSLVGLSGGGRHLSKYNKHGRVDWVGYWFEGTYDPDDMFSGSYLSLWIEPKAGHLDASFTFIPAGDIFYILIDRENKLSTYCGRAEDYDGFRVSVESRNTTLQVPVEQLKESDPIGDGCPLALNCSREMSVCGDRGTCDYCTQQCICFDGYGSPSDKASVEVDDFSPDCSGRICPFGVSFASLVSPSGSSSFSGGHEKTECSSAGICLRSRGECKCFDGYEGAACQRRTCPGEPKCSGRGECKDMSKLARTDTATPLRAATALDHTYYFTSVDGTTWDAQSMMACVCDSSWEVGLGAGQTQLAEFFGPACEFRRCPSGDDPTTSSIDETDCEGVSQTGGAVGSAGNLCHHECSGRGLCDYSTGECKCFSGVEGSNCGTLATVLR